MLGLPRAVRQAYLAHEPGIRAARQREAWLAAGGLPSPGQEYRWTLAETGDEDEAQQAAQAAAAAILEAADEGHP